MKSEKWSFSHARYYFDALSPKPSRFEEGMDEEDEGDGMLAADDTADLSLSPRLVLQYYKASGGSP